MQTKHLIRKIPAFLAGLAILLCAMDLLGESSEERLKVAVIGLDGAEWSVLNPLLEEGKLPNLARLIASGYHGILESTKHAVSPVAWASLITGMNPETHGVTFFSRCEDGRIDIVNCAGYMLADSTINRKKSFFDILGVAKKRVGILYVPFVGFPTWKVNGVMLGSPKVGYRSIIPNSLQVYPETLAKELPKEIERQRKCIFDKPPSNINPECNGSDLLLDPRLKQAIESYEQLKDAQRHWKYRQTLHRVYNLNRKKNIGKHIIKRFNPDVFMVVFDETDDMLHSFWKYSDRNHPLFDSEEAAKHNRLIEYMHIEADRAIGELLDLYDDNLLVAILSDHGFGAYFVVKLKPLLDQVISVTGIEVGQCNEGSKFEYFPTEGNRQIQLCLSPANTTQRDADIATINRVLDDITFSDDIRVFQNTLVPKSGKADIIASFNINLFYGNTERRILIRLDDKKVVIPLGDLIDKNDGMSGYHSRDGIYILSGPIIDSGQGNQNIIDIAPTILYALGNVVPEEIEGKIILEAFTRSFKEKNQPLFSEYETNRESAAKPWKNPEVEKDVIDKLKSLGYVR